MLLIADAAAKYYNGNASLCLNHRRLAMLLTADAAAKYYNGNVSVA
jgi:hypothetical protein